jgi:glutamate racemase
MLEQRNLLGAETDGSLQLAQADQIRLMTTGRLTAMQAAAQRWLDLPVDCSQAVNVCSPSTVPTLA